MLHPAEGRHHVERALAHAQLSDDREHRRAWLDPQSPPGRLDLVRGHRRAGIPLRVDPDARHEQEVPAGNDAVLQRRGMILVVDHDQSVGPSARDPLCDQEQDWSQGAHARGNGTHAPCRRQPAAARLASGGWQRVSRRRRWAYGRERCHSRTRGSGRWRPWRAGSRRSRGSIATAGPRAVRRRSLRDLGRRSPRWRPPRRANPSVGSGWRTA